MGGFLNNLQIDVMASFETMGVNVSVFFWKLGTDSPPPLHFHT